MVGGCPSIHPGWRVYKRDASRLAEQLYHIHTHMHSISKHHNDIHVRQVQRGRKSIDFLRGSSVNHRDLLHSDGEKIARQRERDAGRDARSKYGASEGQTARCQDGPVLCIP